MFNLLNHISNVVKVVHVEGDVNPVRDLEIIQDELRLKDIEHLTKRLADLEKVYTRGGEKKVIFVLLVKVVLNLVSFFCI